MKASEIRSMTSSELDSKLLELKKDLFMLRMQHATNHLDNPMKISNTRRDIPSKDGYPRKETRTVRR
jgi:large subunit ribosomal protein L29